MAKTAKRGRIMECLFCEDLRKVWKPELGKGLICSRCFWVLDSADQDYLKRLYSKSIEEGNPEKAKLVTNFIIIKDSKRKHERKTQTSYEASDYSYGECPNTHEKKIS